MKKELKKLNETLESIGKTGEETIILLTPDERDRFDAAIRYSAFNLPIEEEDQLLIYSTCKEYLIAAGNYKSSVLKEKDAWFSVEDFFVYSGFSLDHLLAKKLHFEIVKDSETIAEFSGYIDIFTLFEKHDSKDLYEEGKIHIRSVL